MNNDQKNQILFSVCLKVAAEISNKGDDPHDVVERAITLHKMFEAYMERLKNQRDVTNGGVKS